uniref:Uncharacterized protein n=1 Tax=Panagrolaimus sp. JU765 TaxID=591449 RepID=A0AC34R121_9BILA
MIVPFLAGKLQDCKVNDDCSSIDFDSPDCGMINQQMSCMVRGLTAECRRQICAVYQEEFHHSGKNCLLTCSRTAGIQLNLFIIFGMSFLIKFLM